jgi:hypothetical protein
MGPTGSGKSTVCPDHFLNYFWDIYHTHSLLTLLPSKMAIQLAMG